MKSVPEEFSIGPAGEKDRPAVDALLAANHGHARRHLDPDHIPKI